MSTKSRQSIYGGAIMGAKIRAKNAREAAHKALREADRAEAEAWSIRMEGYAGPASHRRRSRNVLVAGSAGWKWNATAARRGQACRSTPSAGRATRRSGSSRHR
jgi:hypothetical protein